MRPFSLLVKPAGADCNLRCTYCFYLSRSELYPSPTVHRMSDNVLERTIASFMQVDMPQHAFGWQGGEPTLMGADFFRRVTELQQRHGRRGAVVANGLQTNATLITEDLAEHLSNYQFLVGVSLDGPPEIHDRFRTHADGRGSHAEALRGIERLQRHGVEFNVLTLVNERNVHRPHEVYRYLRDRGYLYHQYIPCVESDAQGRPRPFSITGEQWGEFLCELFDTWIAGDTRRVSIRHFDAIIAYLVDGGQAVCTMERTCCRYFVVEHNGDIFPCDFFVDRGLRIGNVLDMSWEDAARSDVYEKFGRRKAAWAANCDKCQYLALCSGDCLKHRVGVDSEPRVVSRLCSGWKRFFSHTLERFRQLATEVCAERERHTHFPETMRPPSADTTTHPARNDPCPCGSGRKYKRCCIAKP